MIGLMSRLADSKRDVLGCAYPRLFGWNSSGGWSGTVVQIFAPVSIAFLRIAAFRRPPRCTTGCR